MIYRLPTSKDKDILSKYVHEHYNNNETSISASMGLTKIDFFEWVKIINDNATNGNEEFG